MNDEIVSRISYTDKMTSLHWITAQMHRYQTDPANRVTCISHWNMIFIIFLA